MRKATVSLCLLAMLATTVHIRAQAPAAQRPDDNDGQSAVFSRALVGTWKSVPDEMRLTSAFDESVWGPNATAVRTVELAVAQSGEGTLTVTRKILDARNRPVTAATSIEQVKLRIGGSRNTVSTRIEHDVQVVQGVRSYPGDPRDTWDLSGVRVQLVTFADGDRNTVEVRFDTPDGRGSFWETLRHAARGAASRQTQRTPTHASRPSGTL